MLAPFAPHFAEELWEKTGHTQSVFLEAWPKHDDKALELDTVEIAVQMNGQIRFRLDIDPNLDQETVQRLVEDHPDFEQALNGRAIVKWIYVPKRLVNIVVR